MKIKKKDIKVRRLKSIYYARYILTKELLIYPLTIRKLTKEEEIFMDEIIKGFKEIFPMIF